MERGASQRSLPNAGDHADGEHGRSVGDCRYTGFQPDTKGGRECAGPISGSQKAPPSRVFGTAGSLPEPRRAVRVAL